jgi:Sec-independent protein translocase protein TatA
MDVSYFANQLPPDSDFRNVIETMGAAVERFKREAASIKADRRYSAQGHAEQIKAAAEKGPIEFFKEMRKQRAQDRQSLERRKSQIKLQPLDRDDLFGELRARELGD